MNPIGSRTRICATALVLAVGAALGAPTLLPGADEPLHVQIDAQIHSAAPGPVARLCDDADFLRRLSIDLWGTLPTSGEARRFLLDNSPGKRSALIDRLLDHPRYAVHMAHVFDVMLLERRTSETIKQDDWNRYLFESFVANKPYDQLAREILSADGTDPQLRPAVKFYFERNGDPNLLTRDVGRIFFGRDLQCCQCHDHPLIEHYQQADYYGLFAFLQRGYLTIDPAKPENKDKPVYFGEKADGLATFASVFDPKKTRHGTRPRLPGDVELDEPYFAVGTEYKSAAAAYAAPKYSRRARLAEAAIDSANRAFRRNIVNRLWAHMMGHGLFEPVDLDHPDNPAANPALVDLLADSFHKTHYDIRAFLGELARTETYQRTIELPDGLAAAGGASPPQPQKWLAAAGPLKEKAAAFEAQIKKADEDLGPLRKQADQIGDELAKADAKTAEAKKAADAAAEALAKTRATQADAQALERAAKAVRAASARLAGEKDLAQAAALFEARAAAKSAEAKKLAPALAGQIDAARKTANLLQRAQSDAQRVAARWQAANAKLAPAELRRTQARAAREQCLAQMTALKQTAEAVQSLRQYAAHRSAADRAARLAASAKKRADLARQIAAIRVRLASAHEHEAEFEQTFAADSGSAGNVRAAYGADQAELGAAQRAASEADGELRAAENQAKTENSAAESECANLSRFWTSRFAVAAIKPLSPEQLAWNVMQSTGVVDATRSAVAAELEKSGAIPRGTAAPSDARKRAQRIEWALDGKLQAQVARFVNLFGAGPGQPQRGFFATVDQALFFANSGEVRGWLAPTATNLTGRLLKIDNARALAEELYLSLLSRFPSLEDSAEIERYLAGRPKDRSAAVQEVVWALMTSSEFRFNH